MKGLRIADLRFDIRASVLRLAQMQRKRISGQDERLDLLLLKQVEHVGIRQSGGRCIAEQRTRNGSQNQHQYEQQKQ